MNANKQNQVEQWDIFERSVKASSLPENPFFDLDLTAHFTCDGETVQVSGFYDGDNRCLVRFMPHRTGTWHYVTESGTPALDRVSGSFECVGPSRDNHGPVRAVGTHFEYADGTPFFVLGTTAYTWTYQPDELAMQSLDSFSRHGFNKIRMLFFPKQYGRPEDPFHINYSPDELPYEGEPGALNLKRPNPAYYRLWERRLRQLMQRGIEADVILFHVYDGGLWGIAEGLGPEEEMRFLHYITARLAPFRNVWWSLANEYDLFGISIPFSDVHRYRKKEWNALGQALAAADPYDHLRSVHNWTWGPIFPNTPWLTHVSYQHPNTYAKAIELREEYKKPVINDEYQYEGNMPNDFGNCSGELEVKRHWMLTMAGAYGTHGEMYMWDDQREHIFWSTGGELQGDSPPRLAYLKELMTGLPFQELEVDDRLSDGVDFFTLRNGDDIFLSFFGPGYKDRPNFQLNHTAADDITYDLEIHDLWRCRRYGRERRKPGAVSIPMPDWAVVIGRRLQ